MKSWPQWSQWEFCGWLQWRRDFTPDVEHPCFSIPRPLLNGEWQLDRNEQTLQHLINAGYANQTLRDLFARLVMVWNNSCWFIWKLRFWCSYHTKMIWFSVLLGSANDQLENSTKIRLYADSTPLWTTTEGPQDYGNLSYDAVISPWHFLFSGKCLNSYFSAFWSSVILFQIWVRA